MSERVSAERQKALIEAYKRTPKQMGVYAIRHLASGRSFVAASRDIVARWNRHRFELRSGVEWVSPELQAVWTAEGADAFEFTVLDVLEPPADAPDYDPSEDLEVLEALWLEKLAPWVPDGFNPLPGAA